MTDYSTRPTGLASGGVCIIEDGREIARADAKSDADLIVAALAAYPDAPSSAACPIHGPNCEAWK